jgi:ribosomal-protein-serine acetyltransferase
LLLNLAFTSLGMNRVEIACGTKNLKSQAVAERLGFTREGVIRQAEYVNDSFVDHIIYGMIAAEWTKTHAKQTKDTGNITNKAN